MSSVELLIACIIILFILFIIYYIFKAKTDMDEEEDIDRYSISYICEKIRSAINDIINMDLDMLNLNKKDYDSRRSMKRETSDAVRTCAQGNLGSKIIVFAKMKSILVDFGITEDVIDEVLPFHNPWKLTATDKFEILMYLKKRDGIRKMFGEINITAKLDKLKKDDDGYFYRITDNDIEEAYTKLAQPLSYDDKLNIITQRVYEETYGLSAVDLMIMEDESVDSISGGISGITMEDYRFMEEDMSNGTFKKSKTFESIWIVFDGKPIHMEFLSFRSKSTIIRICKNLSEHGSTGHLTSSEGGIKTHLADGSRATIFRPNNGTQWAFFIRKFGSAKKNGKAYTLDDLITDKGSEKPIGAIKWGVRGNLNLFFSGDQNSGKTTNTRGAVREIDRRQPVRTIEADFELYLNDVYSDKNILGVRPSERLNFAKIIELVKSSEAHTILFGETASLEHAKFLVDVLLAGTKRIITTGHWPTSDEMVSYFVHSLGSLGSQEVEAMVARLLHLDIHCVKDNDGHRHIDRITEIIPYSRKEKSMERKSEGIEGILESIDFHLEQMARKQTYYTRDIIVFVDGEYKMINPISEELSEIILRNLPPEERQNFLEFNQRSVEKAC